MKRLKAISAYIAAGLSSLALVVAPVAAAPINVNNINNDPASGQWTTFKRDTGSIELSDEFGAPVGLGSSALKIMTPLSNDKAYTEIKDNEATLLSALEVISYFTYRSSQSTSPTYQAPSINIAIDFNGAAEGGYSVLVFEPLYQEGGNDAVLSDQWQYWDAGDTSMWWSTNPIGAAPNRDTRPTLEEIKIANPDATVLSYAINQGGGNPGLIGGADGLTLNENVYNFELAAQPKMPTNKEECKKDGWKVGTANRQFKNQGDCVSYFASNGRANDNPVVGFFKSIFRR